MKLSKNKYNWESQRLETLHQIRTQRLRRKCTTKQALEIETTGVHIEKLSEVARVKSLDRSEKSLDSEPAISEVSLNSYSKLKVDC